MTSRTPDPVPVSCAHAGRRRRPSLALAVALLALVVAGSSSATAALITSNQIKKGAVTSKHVKNNSLTSADIRNGTIRPVDLSARIRAALATAGTPGATGPQGPAGATGPQGPAGAAGSAAPIDGYVYVYDTNPGQQGDAGLLLHCPADHVVLGGAGRWQTSSPDAVVYSSNPASTLAPDITLLADGSRPANTWQIAGVNPTADPLTLEGWVFCAAAPTR